MSGKTEKRQDQIVELARVRNIVTVDVLVQELCVSAQTVRRDLNALCEQNILRRRHGGAELFEGPLNTPYDQRSTTNPSGKRAIGHAAAALIPDYSTVFISIGTTPEMVAQALVGKEGLTVVTNNLNAAMALCWNKSNRVILPGGEIRLPDRDILGDEGLSLFGNYRADFGVFGVGGVDDDGGLLDFHSSEVRVREKIRENSRVSLLVLDSTKFGRAAPAIGGNLADMDRIIMDKKPDGEFAHIVDRVGERLELVGGYTK